MATNNEDKNSNEDKKPFISLWWGLYVLAVLGFPLFFLFKPTVVLDNYGTIEPFELTDHRGAVFSSEIDKPMVVNFIFTRCSNVCPALTARMKVLQERSDKEDVQLLSITVDPGYDQPEILNQYASKFSTNYEHWKFLTGDPKSVKRIINSFQQAYAVEVDDPISPSIMHSERFILVDRHGAIRRFFHDDNASLNQLILALDSL